MIRHGIPGDSRILESDDRASDPWKQIVVVTFPVFEQADQKRMRLLGSNIKLEAIQAQENNRSEKGNTLVSIDKRMIHDE